MENTVLEITKKNIYNVLYRVGEVLGRKNWVTTLILLGKDGDYNLKGTTTESLVETF